MRLVALDAGEAHLFQSAPGREAGRCGLTRGLMATNGSFQSAPGREAGRCPVLVPYSKNRQ